MEEKWLEFGGHGDQATSSQEPGWCPSNRWNPRKPRPFRERKKEGGQFAIFNCPSLNPDLILFKTTRERDKDMKESCKAKFVFIIAKEITLHI